jgi:hypothetical protein
MAEDLHSRRITGNSSITSARRPGWSMEHVARPGITLGQAAEARLARLDIGVRL